MNGARIIVPVLAGLAFLALWEGAVAALAIRPFVLPAPSAIAEAFLSDWLSLARAALETLRLTLIAFVIASVLGLALAVLFAESRIAEAMLAPYAVALQVTPVVAIAPLVVIWVGAEHPDRAVLVLAAIVAFFPVLTTATLGLKSADRNLRDLFALYGAGRWQTLWRLKLPAALPAILSGLKVAGGLALIGAVVAEFVAGSGAAQGLAWRIVEAGNRLQTAKMFAGLILLSALGIAIYLALGLIERRLIGRWHESRDNP